MARRKKGDPVHGWINLDKPYGMTSTQAVAAVRRALNAQKIGHAGTLDPLATGILPIALGEATKTIPYVQDDIKTYQFTITWGEERSTDDLEGEIVKSSDRRPTKEQIIALLPQFTGEILQTPPIYSAIKINGERAYDLARDGEEPEMPPRLIYIEKISLISTEENTASFEMVCGKGTYVRSVGREMGRLLGCYGYISTLRRTKVGCFTENEAIFLDKITTHDYTSGRNEFLLPLQTVLDDIPALALKAEEMAKIRNGRTLQFLSRPDFERLVKVGLGGKELLLALVTYEGNPVALIEQVQAELKPIRVFNL